MALYGMEQVAYRSLQNALNSSEVLPAPRMRANSTSTPPSPSPQNALQKSRALSDGSGESGRAYRDREVVLAGRRVDIVW